MYGGTESVQKYHLRKVRKTRVEEAGETEAFAG